VKNEMTSRERVMTALSLGQPDRVPWVEAYVHPSLTNKILGRNVPPIPGARFVNEVHEKLCLDNLSYDFKAPLYAELEQHGDLECIRNTWLKTWEDLDKLKKWLPDNTSKSFYANAKEYLKDKADYAAVCVVKIGVANTYNSMGYEDFIYNLNDEPEFVEACLEVWGEWCSRIIERVNEMDFDLVWASEDIAFQQGPMVKPEQYEKHIFPFCKKMFSKLEKPLIYHSDGNYTGLLDYILQYNPKGIANLEPPCTDIFKLKETYGKKACLVGNVDLHYTLTMGTPEETTAEVKEKLERVGKGGGYIIASANGLASYCKPENVLAMNDAILRYGFVS
jgi:Uroporphyrinogen decarboxylase (URO-D)